MKNNFLTIFLFFITIKSIFSFALNEKETSKIDYNQKYSIYYNSYLRNNYYSYPRFEVYRKQIFDFDDQENIVIYSIYELDTHIFPDYKHNKNYYWGFTYLIQSLDKANELAFLAGIKIPQKINFEYEIGIANGKFLQPNQYNINIKYEILFNNGSQILLHHHGLFLTQFHKDLKSFKLLIGNKFIAPIFLKIDINFFRNEFYNYSISSLNDESENIRMFILTDYLVHINYFEKFFEISLGYNRIELSHWTGKIFKNGEYVLESRDNLEILSGPSITYKLKNLIKNNFIVFGTLGYIVSNIDKKKYYLFELGNNYSF